MSHTWLSVYAWEVGGTSGRDPVYTLHVYKKMVWHIDVLTRSHVWRDSFAWNTECDSSKRASSRTNTHSYWGATICGLGSLHARVSLTNETNWGRALFHKRTKRALFHKKPDNVGSLNMDTTPSWWIHQKTVFLKRCTHTIRHSMK